MSAREEIRFWETVTQPFANALEIAFGCYHRKLSRVFTIEGHTYKVCCECGATFHYSLESMSITHRWKLFPRLRRLLPEHKKRKLLRRLGRT